MGYFLGVDQGSNSSRAVLFDDAGQIVVSAAQEISYCRRDRERVEYDARHLLDSVNSVIREVLAELDEQQLEQVSACGIATQRSTVLAWDASGKALNPALSWQDVRARATLEPLKKHEREITRLTGLPLTPYYSASKMHWLLSHADSVKQCARDQLRLSPLVSYLLFHLLENRAYRIDYSNAQRTLLFELEALDWSPRLCDWFGVDATLLPECLPMCADYGALTDTAIPVKAVCGDQNAAMFGLGRLGPATALVNIGSGAFVLRELDRLNHSTHQLTGIAYADECDVDYMREATINGAGNALSWAEQQWHIDNLRERLPDWLSQVEQPPVFINTIGGLGTPWMRGDLQPGFLEDRDYTTAEKTVAIIESIVFLIQMNLELMIADAPLKQLSVSGGLSNLDGLCQKLCNLSGLPVERTEVTEATARGAAWLAAGRPQSWCEAAIDKGRQGRHFMPQRDEKLAARYRLFQSGIERLLAAAPVNGRRR